jgi:5-methylcytosine-specific restriction endonuclease McrA
MPPTHRDKRQAARPEKRQQYDHERGSAASRGYDGRWQKAARSHLSRSPLCRYCEIGAWGDKPRIAQATLVDHFYPHGGERALFWATQWWVSSCKACHDGPKQAVERRGGRGLAALARTLGLPPRPAGATLD